VVTILQNDDIAEEATRQSSRRHMRRGGHSVILQCSAVAAREITANDPIGYKVTSDTQVVRVRRMAGA
jgi:hypothetical protein